MGKKNPKVSIVTVVLNVCDDDGMRMFRQMFDSIHNQTYQNIQHIIIDGASTDGTVEFIKSLLPSAKKEIKFFSEPDSGIYNAMNNGVRKSHGEFIAFMNSDDYYYTKNAIESLVFGCIHNSCDFSCANALIMHHNGKLSIQIASIKSSFFRMPFSHQSFLCKRDLVAKFGFDESFKIASDYDLILKIISSGIKGVEINDTLIFFRWTGASYIKNDEAIEEASRVMVKYYHPIFTASDCKNIFCSNFNFFTFLKYFLFKSRMVHDSREFIPYNRYFVNCAKAHFKSFIRLRFIIRQIEKLYKKLK
jgi:glycosyltransferase involved in cell wall biosynthesis